MKKKILNLFFEEVPVYYGRNRTIEALQKRKEIEKEEMTKLKRTKLLLQIIPLVCLFVVYLVIYFVFMDRFKDISFISWIFCYPLYFYLVMEIYFCYSIIIEFIYMIRYNMKFKMVYDVRIKKSINTIFIFIILEIVCTFLHYILGFFKMYLLFIPLSVSIIIIYLYFKFITSSLSKAYKELTIDFE